MWAKKNIQFMKKTLQSRNRVGYYLRYEIRIRKNN